MNYKEYEKLARMETALRTCRKNDITKLNGWVADWFYTDTKHRLFKALYENESEVFVRGYSHNVTELFISGFGMSSSEVEQCILELATDGVNRAILDFTMHGCWLDSPDEWNWTSGQPTMTIKLMRSDRDK